MILNALLYQGSLAIIIAVLYFYVEPRLKHEKGFFASRNIVSMFLMIPFAEFFVGFLLQAEGCSPDNKFCIAVPDLFRHSVFYDIFYLRVNDTYNGAHWIDYMFLPLLFFFTWFLTKDAFFSALNSAFMVFVHETIWFAFYWVAYYQKYQYEGWFNDFAFFLLVGVIGAIGIIKYGKRYYSNQWFLNFGLSVYVTFLVYWYIIDDFKVTVINNTALGDSLKFLVTQWYNDPLTNELEVFSWVIIFLIFVVNIYLVKRKENESNIKSVLVKEAESC